MQTKQAWRFIVRIYNAGGCFLALGLPMSIFILVALPYAIIFQWSEYGVPLLVIGIPIWLLFFLPFRGYFGWFFINEKGITSRFPFNNVFIAWNEMKYIGVGAERYQGQDYRFTMYFSKVPMKKEDIFNEKPSKKHKKQRFYIVYNVGLLEEILKYVDEEKIRNIEWIKNCPAPWERQQGYSELVEPDVGRRL